MRNDEVEIGMRVVPTQKTTPGYCDLPHSNAWRRACEAGQGFLYVIGFESDDGCWTLTDNRNNYGGDFFMARDFHPYDKTTQKLLFDEP